MATAMDAGLISRAKAMGIKSGVTSRAVDVFIRCDIVAQGRSDKDVKKWYGGLLVFP